MISFVVLALASPQTLFASPGGNDRAPGTIGQPLMTIAKALELAKVNGIRRIALAKGEYPQTKPLDATGLEGLCVEAQPGVRPLITGAVRVPKSAISLSKNRAQQQRVATLNPGACVYEINVAKILGAKLASYAPYGFPRPIVPGMTELFANDQPLRLARWPNEGFTRVSIVIEPGNDESDRNAPPRRPTFLPATGRAKSWKSAPNAWLYGYWKYDWADETIKVDDISTETGEITLATPHTYGVGKDAQFFVENLEEELDAVGEYYVDLAQQTVRFVALRGTQAEYRLSVLGEPLIWAGSKSRFVNLDFAYSRGDGARVAQADRVVFEGCRFFNLGQRGLVFENTTLSGLLGCDVWNTAEGGVVLSGGNRGTLEAARNFVANSDIHHFQRRTMTYRPAVLISGVGNEVRNTNMRDAPHSAIIFSGNDHLIARNRFFRTVSRTGDGGVIYTGRDWTARGTKIEDNYFHDNVGISKWEPAIYFDDQASGLIAKGNVIERCHWGFLIGGGRDNLIEDNVIVDCKLGLHCDARGLGWAARSRPTMEERLAAVPYRSEVWKLRYPALYNILAEDPMAPARNTIRDNQLIRSGPLMQDTEAPFAKSATYLRNSESNEPVSERIKRRIQRAGLQRSGIRPQFIP